VIVMVQQGQVLRMKSKATDGSALWGYRYRIGGRDSRRVQRGGYASEQDAAEALERALERLRRVNGTATTLTLACLVEEYLAQHDAQPETIEKLRWLLAKSGQVIRRSVSRGASFAGDRGLADDDRTRPSFRGGLRRCGRS
jgi:hypothetical protein